MSLIYITGPSGSGKSAVLCELSEQGFEVYGVDEDGFADWINRNTHEIEPLPHDDPMLDIHEWYKKHRWVLSQERITKLKHHADETGRTVFLLGVAEGDKKVWHLFSKVLALSVNEMTIRTRIEGRQDNQFGKTVEEMAEILGWLENYDETYRAFGAIVIDAIQSLDSVVKDILEAVR